jgi:hypothetical protein
MEGGWEARHRPPCTYCCARWKAESPALSSFLRSDLLEKWHQSPVSAAIYVDQEISFGSAEKQSLIFPRVLGEREIWGFRFISQFAFF